MQPDHREPAAEAPTDRPSPTFSLARLMGAVTMICVACGMAVSLPGLAQIYLVVLVVVLPVIAVHFMFARLIASRNQAAVIVSVGFALGMLLAEPFTRGAFHSDFDSKGFARILTSYAVATVPAAMVAIIFAASFVLITRCFSWWNNRDI